MDVENVKHFNKLDKTACPLESMSDYREMRLIQFHYVSMIFPYFFNRFTYCSFVGTCSYILQYNWAPAPSHSTVVS
jgi:hypothetical protein